MKRIKKIIKLFVFCMVLFVSVHSYASYTAGYEWSQVKLGGGGYVTGAIFHPKSEGLAYIRTDVGGMYRRNSDSEEWEQLFDFPLSQNHLYGVDGFAVDPDDPDVVYAALGMYYWLDGGLYKSNDRGETWTKLVSARCNGNKLRRNYGECVAIDPENSDVIYFGTRYQGLYRSSDGGKTWDTINGIDFLDDTEKSYGIRNVVVDTSQGKTAEGASAVVYLGSAGVGVYKSTDGGKSFTFIEGSPDDPFRMSVSSTGVLYASDDNGLFKYSKGTWSDISPVADKPYQALAVSPTDPNMIMTCVKSGSVMKLPVYLSTNGGKSWSNTFEGVTFTEQVGWLESDNFSSNTAAIAVDPFDRKHIMITDWFGVWETDDITKTVFSWASFGYSPQVHWYQKVYGIEEMCPYKAVCPPGGDVRLHLGVMDNDGFSIKDINEYPERKFTDRLLTYGAPRIQSTTDLAFCEEDSNILVRVGIGYSTEAAGYSLDGGKTWQEFEASPIEEYTGDGCNVAVSCKNNTDTGYPTVIFNQGGYAVKMSRDMGKTWTELPFESIRSKKRDRDYNKLESDKVNPDKFYIYNNDNKLYISDDGGESWYAGADVPEAKQYLHIRTAPGIQDEIWVGVGGEKLYRSSDGGKTLTAIGGVSNVQAFCFGMPMTGSEYPTAFVYATVYGTKGIYRSVNMGKSWVNITPDDFVLKDAVFMEGDRQEEGVVYFIHSGTGVYCLEPNGEENIHESGTEYTSDFENNSEGWTFSGSMTKQNDSLGCGAYAKGGAVLDTHILTDSYEIFPQAVCKGAKSGNRIRIMFNYIDDNNFIALEILGGDNAELTGGARLYKMLDGKNYIFADGEWYENTDENAEKISGGLVSYKTNSYTYKYRIIYDSDGYITVYKYNSNGDCELIFDNCAETDLRCGKIGFYALNSPGTLSSITVKTQPVIVRKTDSDNEGVTVEFLDNGYYPDFRAVLAEKNSTNLVKCSVTEPIKGKIKIKFPPLTDGNYGEIFVFNSFEELLPLMNKISVTKN